MQKVSINGASGDSTPPPFNVSLFSSPSSFHEFLRLLYQSLGEECPLSDVCLSFPGPEVLSLFSRICFKKRVFSFLPSMDISLLAFCGFRCCEQFYRSLFDIIDLESVIFRCFFFLCTQGETFDKTVPPQISDPPDAIPCK